MVIGQSIFLLAKGKYMVSKHIHLIKRTKLKYLEMIIIQKTEVLLRIQLVYKGYY